MQRENDVDSTTYLTKLEQPETIKKIVPKLLFNVRVTWRRIILFSNPAKNLNVKRQVYFFFSLLEFLTFMFVNFCFNLSTSIIDCLTAAADHLTLAAKTKVQIKRV